MSDIIDQIMHNITGSENNGSPKSIRVMTVRMPAALHDALKAEARARGTSANQLAVAKLSIRGETLDKVVATLAAEHAEQKAMQERAMHVEVAGED